MTQKESGLKMKIKKPTIRQIQIETANYFNLDLSVILSPLRKEYVVRARHISIYLCRELIGQSFPMIAAYHGGRDHSTAIHAHKKIENLLKTDEALKIELRQIKSQIIKTKNNEKNFMPFFWKEN